MEVKITNVALKNFFRVKIAAERGTGILVELNKRAVVEASEFESFC